MLDRLAASNPDGIELTWTTVNDSAYALLSAGKVRDAIAVFAWNTVHDPREGSWESLGEAYQIDHQVERAREAYRKALAIDPNDAYAKRYLSWLP